MALVLLTAIAALPGVPGIFLENIQADLRDWQCQVRVGYFGMLSLGSVMKNCRLANYEKGICLPRTGSDADKKLQCATTQERFSDILIQNSNSTSNATKKLLVFASGMQRNSFAGALSIAEVVRSQQELLSLGGSNNITVKIGVVLQFL
ncbi:hypothetical protein EAF04_005975 [Stromatinia cepivora]|nr:hypothetical protein EAF04_005975 [Stromatinia cepivora]